MPDQLSSASRPGRKRVPKAIAVIDRDHCTGCQACCEVCPVDCIEVMRIATGVMGTELWCEIDPERCIGCRLCIRLPRGSSNRYQLTVCPWEAIEMVPTGGTPHGLSQT